MADRFPVHSRCEERGAALLTVLLLVSVMAVMAAVAMERMTLSTRLTGNADAMAQARAMTDGVALLARDRLDQLAQAQRQGQRIAPDWVGQAVPLGLPVGQGSVTPFDGGNCFNLNSVVTGDEDVRLSTRPIGMEQFAALLRLLGSDPAQATVISASLADWIDSDSVPQANGAEDETYQQAEQPYRTANRMMVDPGELMLVHGVTPALYARLRPWICALPSTDLSPINVNTLAPGQALLLAMLIPHKLDAATARGWIEARPGAGFPSTVEFWGLAARQGITPMGQVAEQVVLKPRWFRAEVAISLGDAQVRESLLFDATAQPVTLAARGSAPGN